MLNYYEFGPLSTVGHCLDKNVCHNKKITNDTQNLTVRCGDGYFGDGACWNVPGFIFENLCPRIQHLIAQVWKWYHLGTCCLHWDFLQLENKNRKCRKRFYVSREGTERRVRKSINVAIISSKQTFLRSNFVILRRISATNLVPIAMR